MVIIKNSDVYQLFQAEEASAFQLLNEVANVADLSIHTPLGPTDGELVLLSDSKFGFHFNFTIQNEIEGVNVRLVALVNHFSGCVDLL